MVTLIKRATLLVGIAALVACGGGGPSTSNQPVVTSAVFNVRAIFSTIVWRVRTETFTITGSVNGTQVTGSGTESSGSLTSATFEGEAASKKVTSVSMTLSVNGTTIPMTTSVSQYFDSNYGLLGEDSDEYGVVSSLENPSTAASVGDTATLATLTNYSSSAKITTTGTSTLTWVLEPRDASSAYFLLVTETKDTSNNLESTSTSKYVVTPDGGVTSHSATVVDTQSNTILNIRY